MPASTLVGGDLGSLCKTGFYCRVDHQDGSVSRVCIDSIEQPPATPTPQPAREDFVGAVTGLPDRPVAAPLTEGECKGLGGVIADSTDASCASKRKCWVADKDGVLRSECITAAK